MNTTKQHERLNHAEEKVIAALARRYGYVAVDEFMHFLQELLTDLREDVLASTMPKNEQKVLLERMRESTAALCEKYGEADQKKAEEMANAEVHHERPEQKTGED